MASVTQVGWLQVSDEETGGREVGLSINVRGRTVQAAGRYLPQERRARENALARWTSGDRDAVVAFDQTANMRVKGRADRVRREHRWCNKRFNGVVVVPTVRPVRSVLEALADSRMGGPLEDWLLVYAAEQAQRWPRVETYMVAMGCERWASQDAALKLLGRGASYKEGALSRRMNQLAYTAKVKRAESILWGWIVRASEVLIYRLDSDEGNASWRDDLGVSGLAEAA